MRIALLLPIVVSLATACRGEGDSSSAAVGSAGSTPGGTAVSLSPALGSACSAMARISRSTLRIAIGRDRASSFRAPRATLGTWQGCRLVGNGTMRADSGAVMPDKALQPPLLAEGFATEAKFSANAAYTSEFAVRRGPALCVITATYPATSAAGATTTQGATAPRKPYRIEIRCTDSPAAG